MRRGIPASIILVLCMTSVVWAQAADPVTLEKLHEGEQYGRHTRAKILARKLTSDTQANKVAAVHEAREAYRKALEDLRDSFEEQGNAEGLRRAKAELEDLENSRHFTYQYWEDKLPELSAEEPNEKAQELLIEADDLRTAFNPFNRGDRYRKVAELYRQILQEYPRSQAVEGAAYGLGNIYSSASVGEYKRAVRFFELCYLAKPNSKLDPLYAAAEVLCHDLADYQNAARYYYVSSKLSPDEDIREDSLERLEELQEDGYGRSFTDEPVEDEADAEEAEEE